MTVSLGRDWQLETAMIGSGHYASLLSFLLYVFGSGVW